MGKNKFIILFILSLIFIGCSTDTIDNTLSRAAGNKTPQFFRFPTSYDANHYMFYHKDFNVLMAKTKPLDWTRMSGWSGAYIYGGVGMGVRNPDVKTKGVYLGYGINFSSSTSNYTERESYRKWN